MADKKISQLTALSAANLAPSTDVLAIVDTSATETKKIVAQDLINGVLNVASAVGIGTASPGAKLHVLGSNLINIFAGTNANSAYTEYRYNSTTVAGYIGNGSSILSGASDSDFMVRSEGALKLLTNGNNARVTIDTSGNLGLGVTPSAWDTSVKVMEFPSSSLAVYNGGITHNAFFDSVNSRWEYRNPSSTPATFLNMQNGAFAFNIAGSGTQNNLISFTQAMTLDASGRLLVGKTTNFAGEALQIDANGVGATVYSALIENSSTSTSVYNVLRFKQGASGSATGYIGTGGSAVSNNAFANNFVVGTQTSNALVFNTNDTERGRFTAGGYFKASNDGTYFSSTGTVHEFRNSAGDNHTLIVHNTASTLSGSGARGIYINYTASPNATDRGFVACFDGNGANERATIRSNGGLANYQSNNVDISDARTKKDIAPAASMWGKIGALEIVTYKYNDQTHDDVNVGVIAQQVESVEPVWVDADGFGETPEDGVPLKTVYTKDITFAAIKALQEAMARIEQLEAKVAALESA